MVISITPQPFIIHLCYNGRAYEHGVNAGCKAASEAWQNITKRFGTASHAGWSNPLSMVNPPEP